MMMTISESFNASNIGVIGTHAKKLVGWGMLASNQYLPGPSNPPKRATLEVQPDDRLQEIMYGGW
jgi:hypothetical protein